MRAYYSLYCNLRSMDYDSNILGVSLHYEIYCGRKVKNDTGKVLLSLQDCGAGLVSHELLHAVLWAYKHKRSKKQYPIVIKNMNEEEKILQNHTYAVKQFYNWYWKVIK